MAKAKKTKKTKKSMEEISRILTVMDEKTVQAEKDLLEIQNFLQRFEEIENNVNALIAYYHSPEWMEDTERFHAQNSDDEYHHSASEDAIWNATQGIYVEKIKLLKRLANSI